MSLHMTFSMCEVLAQGWVLASPCIPLIMLRNWWGFAESKCGHENRVANRFYSFEAEGMNERRASRQVSRLAGEQTGGKANTGRKADWQSLQTERKAN